MANRYWVGGTGTWDTASTTNWAATSGGAPGASAPTSADAVIFDANSDVAGANFSVFCSSAVCLTLSSTNSAATASFSGGVTAYGNATFTSFSNTNSLTLTLAPTGNMTLTVGSAASNAFGATVIFSTAVTYTLSLGTSATYNPAPTYRVQAGTISNTFNTAGFKNLVVEGGTVTTSGTNFTNVTVSSGSLTMSAALTCQSMFFNGGTLNKATFTLTCTAQFNCDGSTARSIAGTSSGATTVLSGASTIFSCDNATNLTLTNPQTLSATNTAAVAKTLGGPSTGDTASNTFSISVAGTAANTFDILGAFLNVTINPSTAKTIANGPRKIYGDWNGLSATYTAGTAATTFAATTTGRLATFAESADFPLIFDGVGGEWTLNLNNSVSSANSDITVTNGSLLFTNAAITQIKSLISSNSNTRTIVLPPTNTITITGTTPVDFTNSTNLTLDTGSGTIECTSATVNFNGGGQTFYNVDFSSTALSAVNITGANTYVRLATVDRGGDGIGRLTLFANQTISSGSLLTGGVSTNYARRLFITSDQLGVSRTITNPLSVSFRNCDFRDIVLSGAGGRTFSGGIGNCGGNTGVTATVARTVYLSSGVNATWGANVFSDTSSGVPDNIYFPLPQDTAIIDNNTFGTGNTVTISRAYNLPTITCTNTKAYTLAGSVSNSIYGDLTLTSPTTVTYSGTLTFQRRGGTQTITTNGVALSSIAGLVVENIGGTVALGSALTMTGDPVTVRRGTFSQAFNLTCGTLTAESTATAYSGAAGTTASCTDWTFPASGPTISLGSGHTIRFTGIFAGGGKTYETLLPGDAAVAISDSNTIATLSRPASLPATIAFQAGSTQTITGTFLPGGLPSGNRISLRSSTPGTRFNLSKSSGTVDVVSLDIQDSNATGGAAWNALTSNNNVDSGNNLGWVFAAITAAFFMLFGA